MCVVRTHVGISGSLSARVLTRGRFLDPSCLPRSIDGGGRALMLVVVVAVVVSWYPAAMSLSGTRRLREGRFTEDEDIALEETLRRNERERERNFT